MSERSERKGRSAEGASTLLALSLAAANHSMLPLPLPPQGARFRGIPPARSRSDIGPLQKRAGRGDEEWREECKRQGAGAFFFPSLAHSSTFSASC